MDSDAAADVYSRALLDLAGGGEGPARLQGACVSARAVSPVCGSEVVIDLRADKGRITALGFEVQACALTKSVLSVMKTAALDQSRDQLREAAAQVRAMLEGKDACLHGGWSALALLEPVRDFRARHDAILLPFEATDKAFEKLEKRVAPPI